MKEAWEFILMVGVDVLQDISLNLTWAFSLAGEIWGDRFLSLITSPFLDEMGGLNG